MVKVQVVLLMGAALVGTVLQADPFSAPFSSRGADPFAAPTSSFSTSRVNVGDSHFKSLSPKKILAANNFKRDDFFVILKKDGAFKRLCDFEGIDDPGKWGRIRTKLARSNVRLAKEIQKAEGMMNARDGRSGLDGKRVSASRTRENGRNLFKKYSAERQDNQEIMRIINEMETILDEVRKNRALMSSTEIKNNSGSKLDGDIVLVDGQDLIIYINDTAYYRLPMSSLAEDTTVAVNEAIIKRKAEEEAFRKAVVDTSGLTEAQIKKIGSDGLELLMYARTEQDYYLALSKLRGAAKAGNLTAIAGLAYSLYPKGYGNVVLPDAIIIYDVVPEIHHDDLKKECVIWTERLFEINPNWSTAIILSLCYIHGVSGEPDAKRAVAVFEDLGARQPEACYDIVYLMSGIRKDLDPELREAAYDPERAYHWLSIGLFKNQYELPYSQARDFGEALLLGGIKSEFEENNKTWGRTLLSQAAKSGDLEATRIIEDMKSRGYW